MDIFWTDTIEKEKFQYLKSSKTSNNQRLGSVFDAVTVTVIP